MIRTPLILRAFQQPDALTSLRLAEWDLLLRQARRANLLSSIRVLLEQRGLIDRVPPQPREHLEWSRALSERHLQAVRQEVNQITKALDTVGVPVILLKGAAYVMAELPLAQGRLFSDIDIMVPRGSINAVEAALMLHGWATTDIDAYDQRYYRTWMHELPPMRHIKRMTVIDVHHAILPETAYVRPDPEKLRSGARIVDGHDGLKVLSPTDMVLHSAVHLFHEGELHNGLRDLVDIDNLLRHHSCRPSFWAELIDRAKELELARTLFYALRYTTRILHTPAPSSAIEASQAGRPNRVIVMLMDALFLRALMPDHPSCSDWLTGAARWMLYVRANWLRMPPLLLARHLFHKAFISPRQEQ